MMKIADFANLWWKIADIMEIYVMSVKNCNKHICQKLS